MSETPLNVFGRADDAAAVARLVADTLGSATVERDGPGFRVTAGGKRRFRRAAGRPVTVTVSPQPFAGAAGDETRRDTTDLLANDLHGPGVDDVLAAVPDLRLAVAVIAEDIDVDGGDALFDLALAVAGAADGFVLDLERGRVWAPDGGILASTGPAAGAALPATTAVADDKDDDQEVTAAVADPPIAGRVVARLLALTAVAARGLAENDGRHAEAIRTTVLDWTGALDLDAELDADERAVLWAPAGGLDPDDRVDAAWRVEAAGVLAWALGLLDEPAHDEPVDPAALGEALAFPDAAATRALVEAAALRPRAELDAAAARLLAVHWRLREHAVRSGPVDLAEAARSVPFGPLDLTGLPLVGGDLALRGRPVAEADDDLLATTVSAVGERHQAANWLRDGGVFAETDTPT